MPSLPDDPGAGLPQQDQAGSGAIGGRIRGRIAASIRSPSGTSTTAPAGPLSEGKQTRRILFLVPNFTRCQR